MEDSDTEDNLTLDVDFEDFLSLDVDFEEILPLDMDSKDILTLDVGSEDMLTLDSDSEDFQIQSSDSEDLHLVDSDGEETFDRIVRRKELFRPASYTTANVGDFYPREFYAKFLSKNITKSMLVEFVAATKGHVANYPHCSEFCFPKLEEWVRREYGVDGWNKLIDEVNGDPPWNLTEILRRNLSGTFADEVETACGRQVRALLEEDVDVLRPINYYYKLYFQSGFTILRVIRWVIFVRAYVELRENTLTEFSDLESWVKSNGGWKYLMNYGGWKLLLARH